MKTGQYDIFGHIVSVDEPRPAKKARVEVKKTQPLNYKFRCYTSNGIYIVYAQHSRQAYCKCTNMYGSRPKQIECLD